MNRASRVEGAVPDKILNKCSKSKMRYQISISNPPEWAKNRMNRIGFGENRIALFRCFVLAEFALAEATIAPESPGFNLCNRNDIFSACFIFHLVCNVEFCKGARQSGLMSVWQHTLVGQRLQGFL